MTWIATTARRSVAGAVLAPTAPATARRSPGQKWLNYVGLVVVGPVASASAQAPQGILVARLSGPKAAATAAAPAGTIAITTPQVRVSGPVATVAVQAPAGSSFVRMAGPVATVLVVAPAGTTYRRVAAPVATVAVQAPAGALRVVIAPLTTGPGLVTVMAPSGKLVLPMLDHPFAPVIIGQGGRRGKKVAFA